MTDETKKNATSDLLGAVRAETVNDKSEGTDAPAADAETGDAAEAEIKKPTPRHDPRA
jgi:hypothetical protein